MSARALDGEEYEMKPGYVIAVKGREIHSYRNESTEDLMLIVCNTKPI